MYFLLLISLMFALLLVLNLLISTAATALWRVISPAAANWSASRRAQTIFALRIFPFASALIFVFVIVLPAYLLFEPHTSDEVVSIKLATIAIVSAAGITVAFYRVFGTWWKTRRLVNNWLKHAEQIQIENVAIPVYRMPHTFPVIAVVGIFHPKMFVARQIFDSLNSEEIQAAIAHEYGHLCARDNFKRTLMRVCRDLLVFPFGRSLDRAWTETAESAADEFAAQTGGSMTAVNLAAALVKIARLAPRGSTPAMPLGAFLLTEQADFVSWRVRRLLELTENKRHPAGHNFLGLGIGFWLLLSCIIAGKLLLATNRDFMQQTHGILETIVIILQ